MASGRVLATLPGDSEPVTALAWSPCGRRAYTASRSLQQRAWDVAPLVATGRAAAEAAAAAGADALPGAPAPGENFGMAQALVAAGRQAAEAGAAAGPDALTGARPPWRGISLCRETPVLGGCAADGRGAASRRGRRGRRRRRPAWCAGLNAPGAHLLLTDSIAAAVRRPACFAAALPAKAVPTTGL